MHRLVHFKLKKKTLHDSNRSTGKELSSTQSENSLPVLELSLPDSKSFRASIILPDLSRRFTLLRRNGDLLPIDNFCEHVRHELETGQITVEDENILIHQYRQQYLSEKPSHPPCSPTSPRDPDGYYPLYHPPPKVTTRGTNLLFSGSSTARDHAYINQTIRMSNNNQKKSEIAQSICQTGFTEQLSTLDESAESFLPSASLDERSTHQSSQDTQTNQTKSVNLACEDRTSVEITQAQLQRLSLAVDRILGSQLLESPNASNFNLESASQADRPASPPCSVSIHPSAESWVHEELLRALPDESSPIALTSSSPWLATLPDNADTSHKAPFSMDASVKNDEHSSQESQLEDNSVLVLTASDGDSLGPFDDDLEFLSENCFENESSVFDFEQFNFDHVPQSAPIFNRDQPLPLLDWTYADALFIQQTLCSSHSDQFQQQPPAQDDLTYDDVLFIQGALCSPHSHYSHQPAPLRNKGQLECNFSSSTSSSSIVGSPDILSSVISPRSSSLHHRLNLAKNLAMDSGRKMTPFQQSTNILPSSEETSLAALPSLSHQILSPSTDSPDISSFPLTPPSDSRSSMVGQAYIPSPTDFNHSYLNEIYGARSKGLSGRGVRPIPTTLFRDVEAQVDAANAALRKVSNDQIDGFVNTKNVNGRKKSISTAQVGAPKLLSASAKLSEIELARSALDRIPSHADTSKDISKKGGFKLKLRKKRPSESRLSRDNNDDILDVIHQHQDSSKSIQIGTGTPAHGATSIAFLHARDSITASPIQTSKYHSTDPSDSLALWKHPQALTNRVRKFMGRQKKLVSNPSVAKHNAEAISSIDSNETSSEVALVSQVSHLQTSEDPQGLGLENDAHNAWPPPAIKSTSRSKNFKELGLSSSETPSRDSDPDDHRHRNSLVISIIPPDQPYLDPANGQPRRSWAEIHSLQRPQSNKPHPICQSHLESDGPAVQSESHRDSLYHIDPTGTGVDALTPQHKASTHIQVVPSSWLEVQGSEPQSPHSDCASSILDLYGCDSQSTTASSPKRSSSVSYYSNHYDLSRPPSGFCPSNRIQHPRRHSKLIHSDEKNVNKMTSYETPPSSTMSMQRNSTQNELMVMVQQLQNSTRLSEFEPTRSSLNPTDETSAASFIKHIVNGHPSSNSFKMINGNSHRQYVEDDDEAEVWKQILKG